MRLDNEEILLLEARKGKVEAFEELTSTYYSKVYNTCYRMLNNSDDASELAQETFIRAFKYIKDFKGNCSFSTWVYRIASNVCLDHLRKFKNKKTISLEQNTTDELQVMDLVTSTLPGPEEIAEINAKKAAIRECLAKMNKKNREVIILRDFMCLTYEEISDALKCPVGTVKSRISRARCELRELLCEDKEHLFTDYVKK